MNIVDSSLWIEYFTDSINAGLIEEVLKDKSNLIIPTVIIAEVFKWILREIDEESAIRALALMKYGNVVELNEQIAVNSAYYCLKYKLALADSFIYSSGQFYNATIYTLDRHFENLPNVKYFEKIIKK